MKICMMHIVDTPDQFGGAEKVFLTLVKDISKDKEIQVVVALNKGRLLEDVFSHRVKAYILPYKGFARMPSFYSSLLKMVRDFKPDIIHSHHRYTTFGAQLLPFRDYKLIHTFHLEQFTRKWNRFFGDYATAVSEGCKKHFVKHFNLKQDFITVIYNGVDATPENITEVTNRRKNGEIVASVIGRLTGQKGHSVLIKAISTLPTSIKESLKVIFVGDGDKKSELEKAVIEYDLKNCIEFVGYQKDVYPYIMASDFTISPSLWEGFGLSIVESYLCGRAVIGTNVGGIPEVLKNRETGMIVPPGDHKALSEAILHFINNRDLVRRYGGAGRKLALEKFTVERMINNYLECYKRVLEKKVAN